MGCEVLLARRGREGSWGCHGRKGGLCPPSMGEREGVLLQAHIQQHTSTPSSAASWGSPQQSGICRWDAQAQGPSQNPFGVTDTGRPSSRRGNRTSSRRKDPPDLSRSCPAPPPLLTSPCPSAWCPRASTPGARPIAKLSLWFVTVGLSCVRWSRVGKRRVYSRRAVRGTVGSGRQAQRPPLKWLGPQGRGVAGGGGKTGWPRRGRGKRSQGTWGCQDHGDRVGWW